MWYSKRIQSGDTSLRSFVAGRSLPHKYANVDKNFISPKRNTNETSVISFSLPLGTYVSIMDLISSNTFISRTEDQVRCEHYGRSACKSTKYTGLKYFSGLGIRCRTVTRSNLSGSTCR